MWFRILCLIGTVLLLTGCVFHSHPHSYVAHPYSSGHYIVHSDIEWVMWEYYDWDYDVVVHLHSYNYTPDEISLILFLAYHSHHDPVTIVGWRQSGISWMEITTVHLRLEPTIFFVSMPQHTTLGPPYGKAYGHYWKNPKEIVLTDSEMINLVHLKVTSEAFNVPPLEVIKQREQGNDFNQIVRHQVNSGNGIKTHKGRIVKEPPSQMKKTDTPKTDKPTRDDKPGRDKTDKPSSDDKPGRDKTDKPKSDDKPGKDKDKPKSDDKPKKDNPSDDKNKDKDSDNKRKGK